LRFFTEIRRVPAETYVKTPKSIGCEYFIKFRLDKSNRFRYNQDSKQWCLRIKPVLPESDGSAHRYFFVRRRAEYFNPKEYTII
jgi:hypothetical protein